jgi:tRNA threonylcarbamoyl adenosine modification protein YeaZ
MLILALETSGETCSVALNDGTQTLAVYHFRHERRLSERFSEIIEFLLIDRQCTLQDVDVLAVGIGPGSFTGVRVGVTLAKTFALALNKPLVGVSSLSAIVEPYHRLAEGGIAVCTPTRRTESVVAYHRPGDTAPVVPPRVITNTEIVQVGQEILAPLRVRYLLGENAPTLLTVADHEMGIDAFLAFPTADAVARLALPRINKTDFDNTDTLVPLYVTPSPVGV